MMCEGVFTVCEGCGGEVDVRHHLMDAHVAEPGTEGSVHFVWSHHKCGIVDEHPISTQDYKSALSIMQVEAGKQVAVVASEGDEALREFRAQLDRVRSPADIGAWSA